MEVFEVTTPRGNKARMAARPDTSDLATIGATFGLWGQAPNDEYHLADTDWTGVALDIGAHVGSVTVALLIDNPELRVVAVEALPENVAVLNESLRLNGLEDRCEVIEGAADSGTEPVTIAYGSTETQFAREHVYIGGAIWHNDAGDRLTIAQNPVSLTSIVARTGPVALLKIDCEGGEWSFLDDPAIASVAEIRGEWHPREGHGVARLHELLDATHVLDVDPGAGFGAFTAVLR